jgi:hypothetical protein
MIEFDNDMYNFILNTLFGNNMFKELLLTVETVLKVSEHVTNEVTLFGFEKL